MEKNRIFKVIRMFLVVAMIIGLAALNNVVFAKTITLSAITAWPKSSSESEQFLKFVQLAQEEIDQKYPGELKITYKGAGEVIRNQEQVEAVRVGLIDMVFTAGSYYTSIMPEIDLMSLTAKNPWDERKDGVFDYLEKLHNAKANVHLLARVGAGSKFHLFLTEPIKNIAEMKGKKIRSSATPVPFLRSVGASPIGMPPPDIYTAMERGVIDGYILPAETIRDFGLIKPSKYIVSPGFYEPCQFILLNLDKWNQIPAHLQALLTKQADEMAHYNIAAKQKKLQEEFADFKKQGMQFIEFSPADGADLLNQAEKTLVEAISKKAPQEAKAIMGMIK